MKRLVSLLVAMVFGFNSVFGWSAPIGMSMANVLAGGGLNSALPLPVAKGFEMVNGSMVFTWDKDEVVVGKDEFLKAFFTALQLKDKHFWVDMGMLKSVYEVLDPALVGTIIGKVFIESDIELKKKAMEMLRDVEIEGEDLGMFRLWIVPDKAEVLEKKDGMGVEIKNLRLKVRAEIVRGMGDEIRRYIEGEMVKELTKEVNEGREFEVLRKVFGAIVLARWYKENAREGWPYYEIAGRDVMNDSLREDNWSVREYLKEYGRIVLGTIEANDVPFVGGGIYGGQVPIEVKGKEETIGDPTDLKDMLREQQVADVEVEIDKDSLNDKEKNNEKRGNTSNTKKILSTLLILAPVAIGLALLPSISFAAGISVDSGSDFARISMFCIPLLASLLGMSLAALMLCQYYESKKSKFKLTPGVFTGNLGDLPDTKLDAFKEKLRMLIASLGWVLSGLFSGLFSQPSPISLITAFLILEGASSFLSNLMIMAGKLRREDRLRNTLDTTNIVITTMVEILKKEKSDLPIYNKITQIIGDVKNSDEYNENNLARAIGAVAYQIYNDEDLWNVIQNNFSLDKIRAIERSAEWYEKTYTEHKNNKNNKNNKKLYGLLILASITIGLALLPSISSAAGPNVSTGNLSAWIAKISAPYFVLTLAMALFMSLFYQYYECKKGEFELTSGVFEGKLGDLPDPQLDGFNKKLRVLLISLGLLLGFHNGLFLGNPSIIGDLITSLILFGVGSVYLSESTIWASESVRQYHLQRTLDTTNRAIKKALEALEKEDSDSPAYKLLKQKIEEIKNSDEYDENNIARAIGAIAYQVYYQHRILLYRNELLEQILNQEEKNAIKMASDWYENLISFEEKKIAKISKKKMLEELRVLDASMDTIIGRLVSAGIITMEAIDNVLNEMRKYHIERHRDHVGFFSAKAYWLYNHPQLSEVLKDEAEKEEIERKLKKAAIYYKMNYLAKGKGIVLGYNNPDPTKPGGIDLRAVVLTPVNYSPAGVGI